MFADRLSGTRRRAPVSAWGMARLPLVVAVTAGTLVPWGAAWLRVASGKAAVSPHTWVAATPSGQTLWEEALLAQDLPALNLPLDAQTGNRLPAQMATRLADVGWATAVMPEVNVPAMSLGQLLATRAPRPEVMAALQTLNAALHRNALPWYVDAEFDLDDAGQPYGWLRTYRVDHISHLGGADAAVSVLHLRRADGGSATDAEQALGMRRAGWDHAVVLEDQVDAQWRDMVLPALRGDRTVPVRPLYRQHAAALRAELRAGLGSSRAWRRAGDDGTAPALLGLAVAVHEAQHVRRPVPPVPIMLERFHPHADPRTLRLAASELEATLVEIAQGPLPRLSLVQALSVRSSLLRGPHGLAARALRTWLPGPQGDLHALLRGPSSTLVQRAQRIRATLWPEG